MHMHTIGKNIK